MVYIVFAGLLLLFALSSLVVYLMRGKAQGGSDAAAGVMKAAGPAAVIWVAILAIFTLCMSITTVGSNAVGIQTVFGRYSQTLGNGLHLTAPWASSPDEFSTRVQYLDLDGEHAVPVTFKGGGGGEVKATPRWKIDKSKAGQLWRRFKTFEHVRDQLVSSTAKDSVRVVLSRYTPNDARSGEFLRRIDTEIKTDLNANLAEDGITVDSLSIKGISLDKRSQSSLDKIVAANNDIERARAEQTRAKIDAQTAEIRKAGGSLTGPALIRYCLEVTNNWNSEGNGPLPAGWNCFANNPFVLTNTK